MWNTKKKNLFWTVCLTCGVAICFTLLLSCARGEGLTGTGFEFVQADKYFVPPKDETIAILFEPIPSTGISDCNICPDDYNNICYMMALFGDKKEAEEIIGKKLEPMKLIEGRSWLEKIMNEYSIALKESEERDYEQKNGVIMGKIVFITRNRGYVRGITFRRGENIAYDNYMESAVLIEYFKELGFMPISPRQADKYFIPPKDDTVAILLYRYQSSLRDPNPPIALFGDKRQTEKLLYGDKEMAEKMLYVEREGPDKGLDGFVTGEILEPNRAFEGRIWLEKIIDAYGTALKEAKEREKKEIRRYIDVADGSVIFVTQNEAYTRKIKVGENAIYDGDMDSEQLKTYFDELGLTDELLEGKPPKKFELVMAGDYFAPPADEIVAILLHMRSSEKGDFNTPLALFGDKEQTEKLMGKSLEPERLFRDRNLLKKIADAYRDALKEAGENHFERGSSDFLARIIFVTPTKGYIRRPIGINDDTVYEYYMESELLKKYFDELGLTDELWCGFRLIGAGNYRLPSLDKVVAILLYPQYHQHGYSYPAALFGDKGLTEELMVKELKDKLLEPKKLFEGREWMAKIMNAYRKVLKEAEEKKFLCEGSRRGQIIFVTEKYGYMKSIGVDANTVYDKYMESELLKKYFDELDITDEMGRSKFYIKGYYDVLQANEITAILLYPLLNYNIYAPLALIGDKKKTEKIMGISLEPERIIEGRDWLAQIVNAYGIAIKEANKDSCLEDNWTWQIVFVTAKNGNKDPICAQYMESELLKKYFDELGLTDKLLAGEPNKVTAEEN